jgi:anti-anti-sigma regulatory factor
MINRITMEREYMIFNFESEKMDIPNTHKTVIVDVSKLKIASTTFLHKLLDAKERIILINLHGQPKQIFDICGLNSVIKTSENISQAETFLNK